MARSDDDGFAEVIRRLAREGAAPPVQRGLFGSTYREFMADNLRRWTQARTPMPAGLLGPGLGGSVESFAGGGASQTRAAGPGGPAGSIAGARPAAAPSVVARAAPAGPPRERTASLQMRSLIQRWELAPKTKQPYFDITPDDFGNLTYGYGHKVEARELAALAAKLRSLDSASNQALMRQMFEADLARAEKLVRDRVGPESLKMLNQAQFDALVADAYNAGSGGALGPRMLERIRAGDLAGAGQQFDAYWAKNRQTGQKEVAPGLIRRNLRQAAIFNRGDYSYEPTEAELDEVERAARAGRR